MGCRCARRAKGERSPSTAPKRHARQGVFPAREKILDRNAARRVARDFAGEPVAPSALAVARSAEQPLARASAAHQLAHS